MAGFQKTPKGPHKKTLLHLKDGRKGWFQDYSKTQVELFFDENQSYLWVNIEELTKESFQLLKTWSIYTY
jgi:hypothetical protein